MSTSKSPTAWMFDKSVQGLVHEIDKVAVRERHIYDGLAKMTDSPIVEIVSTDCSNKSCFGCASYINTALHCPVCGMLIATNSDRMFSICRCGTLVVQCMHHYVRAAAKTAKLFNEEDTI